MVEFSLDEKLIVLSILVSIMNADTIIDPSEVQYLDKVIADFKLDTEQLDLLSDLDFNHMVTLFKKFDPQKKEYSMRLFKEMAACDGFVDPREISVIERLLL